MNKTINPITPTWFEGLKRIVLLNSINKLEQEVLKVKEKEKVRQ